MPQLDQRLIGLAESRPPRGAGALIQAIEHEMGERPFRRPAPAVRPIRAMVLAALAIFVFVGGVAVGHWSFGSVGLLDTASGGASKWTTEADITVLATVVAGLSGGAVLLAGALGLTRRWIRRRRIYRSSLDRGGAMETIDRTTDRPVSTEATSRTNRWLAIGLVLALAALAGLGAWLMIDNYVVSDVEQVIADSYAALEANDVDAFLALHTEDILFTTVIAGSFARYEGADELRAWFNTLFDSFVAEATGEIVIRGDYVTHPETVEWDGQPGYEGVHIYRFEDGLISETHFVGRFVPRS